MQSKFPWVGALVVALIAFLVAVLLDAGLYSFLVLPATLGLVAIDHFKMDRMSTLVTVLSLLALLWRGLILVFRGDAWAGGLTLVLMIVLLALETRASRRGWVKPG